MLAPCFLVQPVCWSAMHKQAKVRMHHGCGMWSLHWAGVVCCTNTADGSVCTLIVVVIRSTGWLDNFMNNDGCVYQQQHWLSIIADWVKVTGLMQRFDMERWNRMITSNCMHFWVHSAFRIVYCKYVCGYLSTILILTWKPTDSSHTHSHFSKNPNPGLMSSWQQPRLKFAFHFIFPKITFRCFATAYFSWFCVIQNITSSCTSILHVCILHCIRRYCSAIIQLHSASSI